MASHLLGKSMKTQGRKAGSWRLSQRWCDLGAPGQCAAREAKDLLASTLLQAMATVEAAEGTARAALATAAPFNCKGLAGSATGSVLGGASAQAPRPTSSVSNGPWEACPL